MIIFYDLKTSEQLGTLREECCDFSPDGRMLAVGGEDGVIYIYGVPLNE